MNWYDTELAMVFPKSPSGTSLADMFALSSRPRTASILSFTRSLKPGKDLDQQDAGKMRHLRYVDKDTGASKGLTKDYLQPENTIYWSEKYELPYNVIHGHHVHDMTKPYVYAGAKGQKIVGVDTGCAYGGVLSAYDIISGDYWSVKPKTVYKEVTHQTKLL
jgi:hypothetical protein